MTEQTRSIEVGYLTRVEGEGALKLRLVDGVAELVEFRIFEPPRFFEAFLEGRSRDEVPDITARICGICPVAYQMSSAQAIEAAAGIKIADGPLRDLRHMLYLGEWIESHGLHTFMLHAPDFVGYPDALAMAKDHPEWVKKGLRIKKIGNEVMRVVGGREIHPINVRLGGFYRAPKAAALQALVDELVFARDNTCEALQWMRTFPFPEAERDYTLVSLRHPDEYGCLDGRIVSNKGLDIANDAFLGRFAESHVPYTHALHCLLDGQPYHVGPLARFNNSFEQLSPVAREAARAIGLEPPVRNPFRSLLIRLVEIVHAADTIIRLIGRYEAPSTPSIAVPVKAGRGGAASEAPRGILFHAYEIDDEGRVKHARIIPPTSQNQAVIEDDLRAMATPLATLPHDEATLLAEQAIRNYDPCLSCSTHFLTLTVERDETTAASEPAP